MIKPQTIEFLKDLVDNNNREWFQTNKAAYDTARENVIAFTAELIKLLHKIDPGINSELDPKKAVMRIYRDIRFSKNKTPYKNNFGISVPTSGSKLGGVEYYMHITPGGSFIAGGYWMPEADHLKKIRQEIDYNGHELKTIVDDPEFIRLFGKYREQESLKTVPKGYEADNAHIDLLKLKSFIALHQVTDKELFKKDIAEQLAQICTMINPMNTFLKNALA
jgi:uncharacterized protein (TIGR02453 family)